MSDTFETMQSWDPQASERPPRQQGSNPASSCTTKVSQLHLELRLGNCFFRVTLHITIKQVSTTVRDVDADTHRRDELIGVALQRGGADKQTETVTELTRSCDVIKADCRQRLTMSWNRLVSGTRPANKSGNFACQLRCSPTAASYVRLSPHPCRCDYAEGILHK